MLNNLLMIISYIVCFEKIFQYFKTVSDFEALAVLMPLNFNCSHRKHTWLVICLLVFYNKE